ncbi:NAD(P)-dependent oxidoreductase [Robbsia sp. KACC 23696]|uniref:NAD(P)-dependent oxidoreductase n=1 Tax=Robbsia sp. KACC 23696 TaxID=3149231 RepID=UPI00325C30D5
MLKIFLTHAPQTLDHYYGQAALSRLQALGEVTLNPLPHPLTTEELIDLAQGHTVIVSSRETAAPAALFEQLPELVMFSRVAVDIRNIDVDAASRHGVLVTRASPGFDTSVAEWVIGVMIDLGRGISRAAATYWAGHLPTIEMGRELRGATLGIIGYGFIGQRLASLAKAFGMRIVVYDPYTTISDAEVTQCAFDAVLAAAEYVVCLAPATPETTDLFDAEAFAAMRPDAFFINAARGELLDERALHDALDNGLIAGAAIDVGRAPDQMPSPSLTPHAKLISTPHIGGLTPPASAHQAMDTVRQVADLRRGVMPSGAVNAEQASRLASLPSVSPVGMPCKENVNE